jgi:hypothetical protein
MNHDVRIQSISYLYSLRLVIFYSPEIRSSVSAYLVQSCSIKYFTRSVIRYHFVINSLTTCLQAVLISITEWAWSISLRLGRDKFHLDTYNLTSTFRLPERHLYDHPSIRWRLMTSKLSSGTRDFKASQRWTQWHDLVGVHYLGLSITSFS